MVRGISIVLGLGLVALWIVALSTTGTTGWLTWLDLVGALCAFAVAGVAEPRASTGTVTGGPIGLAIGLFVLWIIALATGATSWLAWWTFAFACAFVLLGIAAAMEHNRHVGFRSDLGNAPRAT